MSLFIDNNARSYDERAKHWEEAMSKNVGHIYLEKPAMLKELPNDFFEKSVLCIGVGSGEELEEILKRNPQKVTAIDISEELLAIAREKYPHVHFERMDMMDMSFPDASFDFVYSSLAFHYANDWDALLQEVYRISKQGGELLFSTHNPGYWSKKPETGNTYTNERGVTLKEHTDILPGDVKVVFYNHPNEASIIDAVEKAGFVVQSSLVPLVIETADVPEDIRESYEKLKEKNLVLPLFFIVHAKHP